MKEHNKLIRIIISVVLLLPALFFYYIFDFRPIIFFAMFAIIYLIIGIDVLIGAVKNIVKGRVFGEQFLMGIATIGAFAIAQYPEAVAVMLFYQIGEFFQDYAVDKSRNSITKLMNIKPEKAVILVEEQEQTVHPDAVKVGDIVYIKAGEKIPVDGTIIFGNANIDTSALTGESMPKQLTTGDFVHSGSISLDGVIKIRAEKVYAESTVAKILELVENASEKKSKSENFITKFAKYYTPIVVISALLLAVIPPLIDHQWVKWIYRAIAFLVVSCPCALLLSIPLSFFMGIGGASKYGVLVKGGNYLELLAKANTFVFDKTGTLTKGEFTVKEILPQGKEQEVLQLAASVESASNHPIATSIVSYYSGELLTNFNIKEVSGKGIVAENQTDIVLCGSHKLMDDYKIPYIEHGGIGTKIYVAKNNQFLGSILVGDTIKADAKSTIQQLNSQNIKTIMLSGDNKTTAQNVAQELNLNSYYSELLPHEKVQKLEQLLADKTTKDAIAFVGDGINDAPALMRADIGISMGDIGSDSAIEASDIVLMHGKLHDILHAKNIAKKTVSIVKQNIIFALTIKFAVLALSAFGLTNMWWAVFADVGVSVIAILNAMRASRKSKHLLKNSKHY